MNNLSGVEMPKSITAGVTINFYVKLRNFLELTVTFTPFIVSAIT